MPTTSFDPQTHGLEYAPEYPPHGFSDHLPMAWQALGALGAPDSRRRAFAAAYLPRLAPLATAAPPRLRVAELLDELRRDGIHRVLRRHLPALISGWYREAYHPLIRLAYGIEFGSAGEVAAALAYWETAGPCPRLAELAAAARRRPAAAGLEVLRQAEGWRPTLTDQASFGARAAEVLEHDEVNGMSWTVTDNLGAVSRAALNAFAATHDFFALHLLTGSHAFRIVRHHLDLSDDVADATLNLGLLAGYVVIGAPALTRYQTPAGRRPPDRQRLLALCRDDEHDVKVAYSAWSQATHWHDPAYLTAVEDYLLAAAAPGR